MHGKNRTGDIGHAVAALAEEQHGVISRDQLRGLGLSDSGITARSSSGYLRPLFRGTYAVGHGAITRHGRLLAAALACGDGTVISHGSACELTGLWDVRPALVDVVPPSWAGREIEGIRWHRVRLPEPDEIEIREGIRCTSVPRTIVDMAGRSGWVQLRRLVERAAIMRQLEVEQIDLILSRGRRRGAPRLRAVLTPWRGTAEARPHLRSPLEARFLPLLIKEGLPAPRTNVKLRIEGRQLEVDMLWDEQRLVVETDGRETHDTSVAFQRDRWRDQHLVAAGYRTARVTWAQIRDEPTAVVNRIARMLNVT